MDEIIENDYNLNISRYVDTFEEEPEINLEDTINKIHDLDKQIEEKTKEVNYSHLRSFASLKWELPTSARKVAK